MVVRTTDYEMKKVKLSNGKVVWRKVRKVIDESKSPLDKLKDFDKSRVASGKKPIFKEQDVMVKEEGGAGYMGTDDLRKKYTNDTPGQTDTINVAHYSAPKPWEIDKPHNEGKSPKTYLDIWNTLSGRRKSMDEAAAIRQYAVYHKDYSTAVQTAIKQAESRGFEVDMDDWHNKVTTGPRKPDAGKTNSFSIDLKKDGKESKKKLHLQVYNAAPQQPPYELNMYIQ